MSWAEQVTVRFEDPRLWWTLSGLAERRGVSLEKLLQELAMAAISPVAATPESAKFGKHSIPVERRKMTAKRQTRLRELHAMGLTDMEIAPRIGVSPQLVHRYRHYVMGLPVIRRGRRTDAEIARVAQIGHDQEVAA